MNFKYKKLSYEKGKYCTLRLIRIVNSRNKGNSRGQFSFEREHEKKLTHNSSDLRSRVAVKGV